MMKDDAMKKLVTAGLLTALITLTTIFVRIPVPRTQGYVNFGDGMIYLTAYMLGNPYAALAAGIGSGLADLFTGAAVYLLPTLVIKAIMGGLAGQLIVRKPELKRIVPVMMAGQALMVLGYFFTEVVLYGITGALISLPYNLIQYAAGIIIGVVLIKAGEKIRL